jgi:hypothetical protein
MVKRVWKELKPDDMAVVTDALEALPEDQRPLYGLTGIKTSFWSRIGGGAKPFIVLFMPGEIILSKRTLGGSKAISRMVKPLGDLVDVSVRNGPLLGSARFEFADGFEIRVGNIPHTQINPVQGFLRHGKDAFAWDALSDTQRTNCYYTYTTMGILKRELL